MGGDLVSLVVDTQITRYDGTLEPLDRLIITRQTSLVSANSEHTYTCRTVNNPDNLWEVQHKYSDGAKELIRKALEQEPKDG